MMNVLNPLLELTYPELQQKNMTIKEAQAAGKKTLEKDCIKALKSETGVKAVTVAFCDIEGKLHMLDYDKEFFLGGYDNLTFDGSSVRGFSELEQSDLRLVPDWGSMRYLPADVFGPGKVLLFGFVCNHDGTYFASDYRGQLKAATEKIGKKYGYTILTAPEVEGFVFNGEDAEAYYHQEEGFEFVTQGGYFNALPQDDLRTFIDKVAEVQRAMAFENEKDHGEVAPSQFEINFKYGEVLMTCDQIMLYKLICRQVAKLMGFTASFLPKPVAGINGSGMHCNMSMTKGGKNIFYDKKDDNKISELAYQFLYGILAHAKGLNLIINPSVNAYRRLDPNFEAPNEIKYSACDRGSMVRIPLGNEKSARIEVRSVAPDANPYLTKLILVEAGMSAVEASKKEYKSLTATVDAKPTKKLHGTMHEALVSYGRSSFVRSVMGDHGFEQFLEMKQEKADRAPKHLGTIVKTDEVRFHHEVCNQILWKEF